MAQLSVGDVCYVDYGEVLLTYHVRLLGCHIVDDVWGIITPDQDVYDEQMSAASPDFVLWVYGGPGLASAIPWEGLVRSRRALKGCRNLDPGQSRTPLAWALVSYIALTLMQLRETRAALSVR